MWGAMLGTGEVTAAGEVTVRGAIFACDTTGHSTGDTVTVIRQGGRLLIL